MKSDRRSAVLILLTILAIAGCGGSSGSSAPPPPPPPPPDSTAPTVSAVELPAGPASRIVTLNLTASDDVGVTEVRFFVDGVLLGSVAAAPFTFDWDTSGETEGDHELTAEAEDAAGNVATSVAVTVTVQNMVEFTVTLSGEEEVPAADSQASAEAALMIGLVSGTVEGEVNVTGLTATAAHIHDAFAGTSGPILIPLDQDPADPARFTVPAGTILDEAGLDRLLAGALYVNVHTAALPGGEIRGQILPEGFVLRFSDLAGLESVPRVDSVASGRAAITLDQLNGALVVQAQIEGLDDADQAHVHEAYAGATGPVLVALNQDPMDSGRWFVEDGELNGAGLDAFAAGRLYVNIHSPANPGGEIRGQVLPEGIALLFTELSGEQEVPVVDTNADGFAAVTLDEAGSLMTLHVNTSGIDDASDAHLHNAFAGVSGPVEIGLTQDGSNLAHWFVEEAALSAEQLGALLAGGTYVNVHSPANPPGEIRGQVIPEGIVFALGELEGSQQVPAINSAASGRFAVTANPAAGTLVAHANTSGADDATAAHLHDAFAGTNGPVIIGLTQDPGDVALWSAVDAPVDAAQLDAIRAGRYYVNVHTPANPPGEIRGQVAPAPIEVLFTQLSGDQEVPAITSAASAIAASTVNRDTGAVTLHLNATGADDAVASHIHLGYAGQNGGVLIGLTQDPADVAHWLAEGEQFDEAGLADYQEGQLYVNLHTPANPPGEVRGQIAPQDIQVVLSAMDGDQVAPPVTTTASGIVSTTTDLASRRFVAFINADGVDDATSASIFLGGLGMTQEEVLPLEQTPMQFGQWSGVSERLDADIFSSYRAGRLNAQLATPAEPDGELRGQIVPDDAAEFDDRDPSATLTSPGATVSGTVALEAEASDDQGVVIVRFFVDSILIDSDTTAPYSIDWDTTTVADGDVTLTAEAEDAAGNVGSSGDVAVTIQNGSPVTLTQIQTTVFGPICSGCHSGPTSTNLPSGMNLSTAAESFAALVGVTSLQVGTLNRVTVGDPENSYLIDKLEGTQTVGVRMPQGGPFLDQATIDMIRQWIADGAANN